MAHLTSYTDAPVTRDQVNTLLVSLGYEFRRERDGFLIWALVQKPETLAAIDGSWPDFVTMRRPYRLSSTSKTQELVFDRNDVAVAIISITGEGPFEVVHRITAVLDEL